MSLTKKGTQRESFRDILIDEEWFSSLNNLVISFFGSETLAPLLFEHGRNSGRTFFKEIRENVQNQRSDSQIYLNKFCEWLRKNGFGILKISNYESFKKCECQINDYIKELDSAYYCGLLTGLLECLWEKNIEIKCYQDLSSSSFKIVLQDDL